MIRNGLDGIVILHHGQHTFRLTEGEVHQLLDQDCDEHDPVLIGRSADRPPLLPVGEIVGTEAMAFMAILSPLMARSS